MVIFEMFRVFISKLRMCLVLMKRNAFLYHLYMLDHIFDDFIWIIMHNFNFSYVHIC